MDLVWDLLDRDEVLSDLVTTWPGVNAVALRSKLIPAHDPEAGPMPLGFAHFLVKDLRHIPLPRRVDRAARYMSSTVIDKIHTTWVNIIHSFLVVYTDCKRPRNSRGHSSRVQAIVRNIEGLDLEEAKDVGVEKQSEERPKDQDLDRRQEPSLFDLSKSIQSMTALFPDTSRPTGEEKETFSSKLTPIIEQMETLDISEVHRPSVLFSLLPPNTPARNACNKLNLKSITISEMVYEVKKKVLFDGEIQDRRVTRWNSMSYDQFRKATDSEEAATRNCLDYIVEYQKDLPEHMLAPQLLYNRIRSIFRTISWCETLFQRTEAHEDAQSFGQKLISAAANQDLRSKIHPKPVIPYHTTQQTALLTRPTNFIHSELVAFFSKTPPPPRHRRPRRFLQRRPFRRDQGFQPRAPKFERYPRPLGSRPSALQQSRFRHKMVCYGCRQPGHFLRDCPYRDRHLARFQHYVNLGDSAAYIMDHTANDVDDEGYEVLEYFHAAYNQMIDTANDRDDDDEAMDAWMADLFAVLDNIEASTGSAPHSVGPSMSDNSYGFVPMSLPELKGIMETLTLYSSTSADQHILLDTGAPRSICSVDWLEKANWAPLQTVALPANTPPFRFAGHPIRAMYGVKLAATLTDIQGHKHVLKIFAYVLPSTPIPFLFGLTDQRRLGFDLCLREQHSSHLRISAMGKVFPLLVTSHVWLRFEPRHPYSPDTAEWKDIISKSLFDSTTAIVETLASSAFMVQQDEPHPESNTTTYLIPPWRRHNWTPTITRMELLRLHRALKHPEKSSISKILSHSLGDKPIPPELKKQLDEFRCSECAERPELPRKPKLALPPEPTPNLAVSLDVMPHKIRNKHVDILVMIDHSDMLLRLKMLPNRTAEAAFNAYLSRWISVFDSPMFTIVDRGSNLAAEYMKDKLHDVDSQLLPIPVEAPWGIGLNERSHRYLHKSFDRLLLQPGYNTGHDHEVLLADAEMGWNFAQHSNNIVPHYHRFGSMPRIIGALDERTRLSERVALIHLARQETATLRARDFISRALDMSRRNIVTLPSFAVQEKVWFHRHRHGWRQGVVANIDPPTIHIEYAGNLYPTHSTRVRPYFGELSIPPPLKDDQLVPDRAQLTEQVAQPRRSPIADLLNPVFITDRVPVDNGLSIDIPGTTLTVSISQVETFDIDSDSVFLTVTKVIKNLKTLSIVDRDSFNEAKRGEVEFLLKEAVKPIPLDHVPADVEIQPLKWVLAKKTTTNDVKKTRHRARLVVASHMSMLRHAVHGNAPTVMLSTLRMLASIIPTWMQFSKDEKIVVFGRDVIKAYIQSAKSQRLIVYEPPPEFFDFYPHFTAHLWRAYIQIYGEVEAGLYWYRTLVPWLLTNFPDLQQSIFDPSLLFSTTKPFAVLLCTDDLLFAIPESLLPSEATIEKRFDCHERSFLPTDFKGVDFVSDGNDIALSQMAYLDTKGKDTTGSLHATKLDLTRQLNDEELTQHRTAAGRLAWVGTGTSPTTACIASIALQGKQKTIALLKGCLEAYANLQAESLAFLRYVPLEFATIHIRVFSDSSFQNLPDKQSQLGFVFFLADGNDCCNIFHWHSSRATRRPASTEEAELLALDVALLRLRNQRRIMFQLLQKEVPVVLYIDNQTLWQNLMNITASSMPEVMFRCREQITDEIANSVCLIESAFNPADAMTKKNPNLALRSHIKTNKQCIPSKRVFMLQNSLYRHCNFIPKSTVPMTTDLSPAQQPLPPSPHDSAPSATSSSPTLKCSHVSSASAHLNTHEYERTSSASKPAQHNCASTLTTTNKAPYPSPAGDLLKDLATPPVYTHAVAHGPPLAVQFPPSLRGYRCQALSPSIFVSIAAEQNSRVYTRLHGPMPQPRPHTAPAAQEHGIPERKILAPRDLSNPDAEK